MKQADLAIILLNWNDSKRTIAMYQQLKNWKAVRVSIIIVDNFSRNEDIQALEKNLFDDLRTKQAILLKNTKNGGFAGGNNLGIQAAIQHNIPYTLLLNTDAYITEKAVEQLLSKLERYAKIGIIGPSIKEGTKNKYQYLIGGRDIAKYSFTRMSAAPEDLIKMPRYPLHAVDYVSGTIFLARTSIFEQVGGLEEQYFFSGEIADFCQLAKAQNYQIAVDLETVGEHLTDKTDGQLRDTLYVYYTFRNRFLYIRRHYSQLQSYYFLFWWIQGFRQLPGAIFQLNFKKIRAILLGLWDGSCGKYGNRNHLF